MGAAANDDYALAITSMTFSYANAAAPVLRNVALTVPAGGFALVVGGTGAGKSTLLRLVVPALAPAGSRSGSVRVFGTDVATMTSAADVGLVLQDADAQIICDDVRTEMAFGLESLGLGQGEMARRIAETATFLGMTPWFDRRTSALSGGERQTLALAAALAMRPRLLLLDEPLSQLDPVAAAAFAALVARANRELGVTVVVATHAPEAFVPYASCAFVLGEGCVTRAEPTDVAAAGKIAPLSHAGAAGAAAGASPAPTGPATAAHTPPPSPGATLHSAAGSVAVRLSDVWFCHERGGAWVLRGLDLNVCAGTVHVLLGGNGCGKTTLLRLIAGTLRTRRGRVRNACAAAMGYLPQAPRALIGRESVRDELMAWSGAAGYREDDARRQLAELGLPAGDDVLARHPYDLSGGQQRLCALAKVLLVRPRLLLLDEPTVGLDAAARGAVARALVRAAREGAAVLVATHDVAVARAAGTVATLLFDGRVAVSEPADAFFEQAWLWGA